MVAKLCLLMTVRCSLRVESGFGQVVRFTFVNSLMSWDTQMPSKRGSAGSLSATAALLISLKSKT